MPPIPHRFTLAATRSTVAGTIGEPPFAEVGGMGRRQACRSAAEHPWIAVLRLSALLAPHRMAGGVGAHGSPRPRRPVSAGAGPGRLAGLDVRRWLVGRNPGVRGCGAAGCPDGGRVGACRLSVDGGDRAPPSGESWVMTVSSGKAHLPPAPGPGQVLLRDQAASRSNPASSSSPASGSASSSPPPSPSSPVAGPAQPAPERACRRSAAASSSSGISRKSAPG